MMGKPTADNLNIRLKGSLEMMVMVIANRRRAIAKYDVMWAYENGSIPNATIGRITDIAI
jgi:hypothetical protein